MYIVSLSPEDFELHQGETLFVAVSTQQIDQRVKQLSAKYPGKIIYTYQLRKKTVVQVSFDMKSYIYTDNGEVLPE